MTKCVSPWYIHNGWPGVKHQVIYLPEAIIVCDCFPLSITAALFLNNNDGSESGPRHRLSWTPVLQI